MNIWKKKYCVVKGKGRVKYFNDRLPINFPRKFRLAM